MNLNEAEMKVLLGMLDDFSSQLDCDGCNDFYLDDTPGNRELVKAATAFCHEEDPVEPKLHDGELLTTDTTLVRYLIRRLGEAKPTGPRTLQQAEQALKDAQEEIERLEREDRMKLIDNAE